MRAGTGGSVSRLFLPAFLFFAVLSSLWALASPIFSSPDENAHALKAVAQVHGELTGHPREGVRYPVVDLPDSYRYSPGIVCFAFHPEVPADCGVELGAPTGTSWFGTWVGSYNPIYYYLVGWPSLLLPGSSGIYAMRIVSALLSSALLAWAFQAAFAGVRRRWASLGVVFLAMPMVLYMAGSVNPQGLEISASAALWMALIRLLESFTPVPAPGVSRRYLWVIVVVASIFVGNARALGPLWVVIIVLSCFALVGLAPVKKLFSTPRTYLPIGVIAVANIFSLGWTLAGGSLSGQAEKSDVPLVGGTFLQGAVATVRLTPNYIQQAAGVFGWLDTRLPAFAYGLFYIAIALVIVMTQISTSRRDVIRFSGLVVLALLVPILVQGYSVRQTGIIWQGRYGLFLYIAIPLVAAWLLAASAQRIDFLSVRLTAIVSGIAAAFGMVSFVFALRRYVVGTDKGIVQIFEHARWNPPLGWPTLTIVFAIASILYVVWLTYLARIAALSEKQLHA